eukprot:m.8948 g.8948  ORF g.8948 m.8948 type:complete len:578 (-) comp7100_c0_seq1:56-1789(-)
MTNLRDEYDNVGSAGKRCLLDRLVLGDGGVCLRHVPVNFQCWGQLNETRTNVLVVCHALTANCDVASWWSALFGPGKTLDPTVYFIVCCNSLGSPYGSASPLTIDQETGRKYGPAFPVISIRDTVKAHYRVLTEHLGIERVHSVIGGSMGGMQALEWALLFPKFVQTVVPIACGPYHSAWQIGQGQCQREAIYADPRWKDGWYEEDQPPVAGLGLARKLAMISYRSHGSYDGKFGREKIGTSSSPSSESSELSESSESSLECSSRSGTTNGKFQVESYLDYQGIKFMRRFDALCYVRLMQMLDTHDIGKDRTSVQAALSSINMPCFVVGIASDALYPLAEQEMIAQHVPGAELFIIDSPHGHDSFLLEQKLLNEEISQFLFKHQSLLSLPLLHLSSDQCSLSSNTTTTTTNHRQTDEQEENNQNEHDGTPGARHDRNLGKTHNHDDDDSHQQDSSTEDQGPSDSGSLEFSGPSTEFSSTSPMSLSTTSCEASPLVSPSASPPYPRVMRQKNFSRRRSSEPTAAFSSSDESGITDCDVSMCSASSSLDPKLARILEEKERKLKAYFDHHFKPQAVLGF